MIRAVALYGIQVPRWKVQSLINTLVLWKGKYTAIVTVGIDLPKNVFAIHDVDEAGKPALVRPNVPRAKLMEIIAVLPGWFIGVKVCSATCC